MEKQNTLKNNIGIKKEIEKTGISELDNINFGLEDYRKDFYKSYQDTYTYKYYSKNLSNSNLTLYEDNDKEEEGYYLFGIFKDIKKYADKKYSFEGILDILKKNIKKYKLPKIKEKGKIADIPQKIKILFDTYIEEIKKEGQTSRLSTNSITKVFYMLLLASLCENKSSKKYIQQEIDFN